MSNDGSSYKPWKVRKGVFKSTGTSEYAVPPRNTPSPIIEMPLSPLPSNVKSPCSPLSPLSPRVTITESSPLSPPIIIQSNGPSIHRTVREIPIERVDEVSEKSSRKSLMVSLSRSHPSERMKHMKQLKISKTETNSRQIFVAIIVCVWFMNHQSLFNTQCHDDVHDAS